MWVVAATEISLGNRHYFIGLDLAAGVEPFTFCIVEQWLGRRKDRRSDWRDHSSSVEREPITYLLRHLGRIPSGMPYTAVVTNAAKLCEPSSPAQPWVVLSAKTEGLGDERRTIVLDLLKERHLRPITVTLCGSRPSPGDTEIAVGKAEVLGAMAALFETRQLKLASTIALVPELLNEYKAPLPDYTPGRDLEAFASPAQDGLSLCVALPLWYAKWVFA
jgi:hypothetical protein